MTDAPPCTDSAPSAAPLAGVRVLDCSRVLAGPYCTVLLSFLGAEIVKVEDFRGDEGRQWPPHRDGMGASFLALNANKKSIAVDLKDPAGAAIVRELAGTADVLVENFKTGDMERFGLGYDDVAPLNPRLVYTSISAFGRRGPKAKDPGYEALVQAYSGVMAITGDPDGGPVRCGASFLDLATGTMSALATVTALFRREATGRGGKAETSLLGTAMGMMCNQMSNFFQHRAQPRRLGTAHNQVVPYQVFATRDGYVFIAAGNQNLYERLCRAHPPRGPHRRPPVRRQPGPGREPRGVHRGDLRGHLGARNEAPDGRAPRTGRAVSRRVNEYATLVEDGQLDALGVIESGYGGAYPEFRIPGLPFHLPGTTAGSPQTPPASASTPARSWPGSATGRTASAAFSKAASSAKAEPEPRSPPEPETGARTSSRVSGLDSRGPASMRPAPPGRGGRLRPGVPADRPAGRPRARIRGQGRPRPEWAAAGYLERGSAAGPRTRAARGHRTADQAAARSPLVSRP